MLSCEVDGTARVIERILKQCIDFNFAPFTLLAIHFYHKLSQFLTGKIMQNIPTPIEISDDEIKFSFIRSPGPGGQNVNKVATGVLLRFNIFNSTSLPEGIRQRLLSMLNKKLTATGDLLIKAIRFSSQARNKQDALTRLHALIATAAHPPKIRKKTKPSKASVKRRLADKKSQSDKKVLRRSKHED